MHAFVRNASISAAIAACTVLAAGAQAPQSATASSGRAQAQAGTMTFTGCIERADQIAAVPVTPGAGATTADSQTFVLIKAEAPATGTAGATGTSGTAGSMYRLDGDIAKISPHVGHRVEITGSLEPPSGTTAVAATPDPNNPGAAANPLAASVAPRLKVDAIKMVADICPR